MSFFTYLCICTFSCRVSTSFPRVAFNLFVSIKIWYYIFRHNKSSQAVAEMFTPYFETFVWLPSSTVQASPDTPETSLMCSHSHGVWRVGWVGWVHQNKNKESRIFVTICADGSNVYGPRVWGTTSFFYVTYSSSFSHTVPCKFW